MKKVSNRCKSCQVETSLLGAFTSLKIMIFCLIFLFGRCNNLKYIMQEANNMRKRGFSPKVIEKYKLNKFQKLADLLNPTQRRTI